MHILNRSTRLREARAGHVVYYIYVGMNTNIFKPEKSAQ